MTKIEVPTLLLDKQKCLQNIQRMVAKADKNNIPLRPHLKTPQSITVANWFKDFGVTRCAVSSLRMAAYYAQGGWENITVAFPVNILEIDRINELAVQVQLNLLVESLETIQFLNQKLQHPVGVFIKIDAGYHRTGIDLKQPEALSKIESLLAILGDRLQFKGFLVHAGHTYKETTKAAIDHIHQQHVKAFQQLKAYFIGAYPELVISYGDTPSCSILEDFTAFDELRPGNFVLYDLSQYHIGSCALEEIAVAMACPVVALHPERSEIIVYGGGVHLSKDRAFHPNGFTYFGQIVDWNGNGWSIPEKASYMISLSQEHGKIKASDELMAKTKVGDLIYVLPIHSCMAVDLMPHYLTLDGEKIAIWDKV